MSKGKKSEASEASRLARVFPDHPLREQELDLGFEGFARTLAELAWNPDNSTPFTVVVRGGWGRGKTTLLRRAQWLLENPGKPESNPPAGVRKVRTLWFNAWKYPDDDTILAGLLGAAIDELRKGGMLDQLKHLVGSYKSATLKALFGLAAPAPLRDLILGDGPESRYAPAHEKRAFHDTFRDLFNEVSRLLFELQPAFRDTGGLTEAQLWSPETQRREVLAVFLDDLDRCRRERVVEVIEAINLFLDLPGVCFFLGIDWERLVEVLPETVQGQADQFLEKVVQVAFDLPEVSPSGAEGYVTGLLEGSDLARVLGSGGERGSEDVRVLARALETRHPRHVKRFLNDLSMTLAVLRNTGKLGEGEEELPEPAVVAWHLLSEILPADRWREVRALPQNLRKFLLDMERLETEDSAEGTAGEKEAPPEWARIRASGLPERHLKVLRELSDRQRHLLVYFATPPAVEAPKARPVSGKRDLFDLGSGAWLEIPGGSFWMGAQQDEAGRPGLRFRGPEKRIPRPACHGEPVPALAPPGDQRRVRRLRKGDAQGASGALGGRADPRGQGRAPGGQRLLDGCDGVLRVALKPDLRGRRRTSCAAAHRGGVGVRRPAARRAQVPVGRRRAQRAAGQLWHECWGHHAGGRLPRGGDAGGSPRSRRQRLGMVR